jgi:hypothetical protein
MHPLDFSAGDEGFGDVFKDAVDGRAALGDGVPLSTAVHLSARFTYVSPAGSVQNRANSGGGPARSPDADRSRRWIRLVDGGYFENSGTVTAAELFTAIEGYREAAEARPREHGEPLPPLARLHPFLIHISNEPVPFGDEDGAANRHRGKQAPLGEALSPLWALLNARPARGYQARDALFKRIARNNEAKHAHFVLRDLDTALPLGWVLSGQARRNMQEQLPHPGQARQSISRCKDMRGDELAQCRVLQARARQTVKDNESLLDQIIKHLDDPS